MSIVLSQFVFMDIFFMDFMKNPQVYALNVSSWGKRYKITFSPFPYNHHQFLVSFSAYILCSSPQYLLVYQSSNYANNTDKTNKNTRSLSHFACQSAFFSLQTPKQACLQAAHKSGIFAANSCKYSQVRQAARDYHNDIKIPNI